MATLQGRCFRATGEASCSYGRSASGSSHRTVAQRQCGSGSSRPFDAAAASQRPSCARDAAAHSCPRGAQQSRRHGRRRRVLAEATAGPSGAFDSATAANTRRTLFNTIAPVYDELNDRLSFGRHWQWKRDAVTASGAAPGHRALDVCCGSGDLAFLLAQAVGHTGHVVGLDFAQDMLEYAEQRRLGSAPQSRIDGVSRGGSGASSSGWQPPCMAGMQTREDAAQRRDAAMPGNIEWLQGDATAMPFDDASFDAVTMGFGLRNVNDIPAALREVCRVLKPSARAAILDFNNSPNAVADAVQVQALDVWQLHDARRCCRRCNVGV